MMSLVLYLFLEYNGWTEKEIQSLKEGLRRYGRAWGKVYREVGGGKSATQCKLFYDNYCTDERLELNASLAEHSAKKVSSHFIELTLLQYFRMLKRLKRKWLK